MNIFILQINFDLKLVLRLFLKGDFLRIDVFQKNNVVLLELVEIKIFLSIQTDSSIVESHSLQIGPELLLKLVHHFGNLGAISNIK